MCTINKPTKKERTQRLFIDRKGLETNFRAYDLNSTVCPSLVPIKPVQSPSSSAPVSYLKLLVVPRTPHTPCTWDFLDNVNCRKPSLYPLHFLLLPVSAEKLSLTLQADTSVLFPPALDAHLKDWEFLSLSLSLFFFFCLFAIFLLRSRGIWRFPG